MERVRFVVMALGASLVVALSACVEPPAAPLATVIPTAATRTTVPAICEKNWLYVRDGDWNDASNWLPSGVPSVTDEVCITGVGTYEINIDVQSYADSVYVGPGVILTFTAPASILLWVDEEFVVAAGASVTFADAASLGAVDVINDGSLAFRDYGSLYVTGRIQNGAYLELAALGTVTIEDLVNTGDFRIENDVSVNCHGRFDFQSGRILGPGTLRLISPDYDNNWGAVPGYVVWSGGVLGARGADENRAQVTLQGLSLILANTTLVGAIDLETGIDTVFGDIGPSVNLKLLPTGQTVVHLLPLAGSALGTPVVNHGTLLVDRPDSWFLGTQYLDGDHVDNRGVMSVVDSRLALRTQRFENRGTFTAFGDVSIGDTTSAPVVRNHGTIVADASATITQNAGVFEATVSGVQSGRYDLQGGSIVGQGRMGHVKADSGVIAPGAGTATLTLDQLTLKPNARLQMEVATPSAMDRIDVRGEATYGGLLEVTSLGSFVGGVCGQVLPMFTDRNSVTSHVPGAFMSFANWPGGIGRFWRAHYARDSVLIAGYDPTVAITTTASTGSLAEGGAAATGQLCLGLPVTGSSVTATLTAARGQFTATASTFAFTRTNFALPQTVRYTAVDDAMSEGPHNDTLTFTLRQGGVQFGPTPPRPVFGIVDNDPPVELAVSIVLAPTIASVGQGVDARYRITNNGPGASTGSTFSIPALAGLTYLSPGPGTSCSLSAGTLTCTVGAIAAGASADVVVLYQASTAGAWTNTLKVRGNDWDNAPANNMVPWVLTIS